ncbi:GIY-YIG nuclease family protein [Paramicrobacterium fandaimingii]|uniref:GIY-YIG nuclease family protein n=1 Tax=Paramicrobacterium fandaimingii TaxID=2708079 RepID=UPI00141F81C7|nr:GIY-YIG nuclease family protein [Microbacterium fandaimingii]
MAPVRVLAEYRLYTVKPSALEHLLHHVSGAARLDLTHIDRYGRDYDPSEWFIVPRDAFNLAVAIIVSGEVVDDVYDPTSRELLPCE